MPALVGQLSFLHHFNTPAGHTQWEALGRFSKKEETNKQGHECESD